MKMIIAIALLFLCTQSFAQLTKKDFKLYLDNVASSDSTAFLTREEFLHTKKLTTNYSWLTIRSFRVYVGSGDIPQIIEAKGNMITDSIKNELSAAYLYHAGDTLIIEVDGYNKQGIEIDWPTLHIVIKK
jgi:hypothetical protein